MLGIVAEEYLRRGRQMQVLGVLPKSLELKAENNLFKDLGFCYRSFLIFLAIFESKFGISIPEKEISGIKTADDLIRSIYRQINKKMA